MYVNGTSSGYAPYGPATTPGAAPAYAPNPYGQDAYMGAYPPGYAPQQPQQSGGLFGGLFNAIGGLLMGIVGLVRDLCKMVVGLVMSIVGPIINGIMGMFGGKKGPEQPQAAIPIPRPGSTPQAQEALKLANQDMEKWEKWANDNQAQIKAKPIEVGEHARKQAEAELAMHERKLAQLFGPESEEIKAFRKRSEELTKLLKGEGTAKPAADAGSLEFVQNLQQLDDLLSDYDAKVPADKRHAAFAEIKKAWEGMKQQQAAFAQSNPELAADVATVVKDIEAKMVALEAKLAAEPQVTNDEIELPVSLR